MASNPRSMFADLDSDYISIHPGDRVRVVHLNKLRTCVVTKHSDGKVYCKWKEVLIVRPFSQVLPK